MFSSLRGKFLAVSLGALCVLGLAMGIAGTQMLLQVSEKREVESIHRTAEVYRSELDLALVRVEDTAGFAATHLRGRAERGDAPDAWQAGQDNSLRLVQETFAGMPAVRAYDVCTIAPDGTVHGHMFTRPSADDAFAEQYVTDASSLLPDGAAEVEDTAGAWLPPAMSPALGRMVITYVQPVITGGARTGFVAVELDLAQIARRLESQTVYDTGFAFLADATGSVHYRLDAERGIDVRQPPTTLVKHDVTSGGDVKRFNVDGVSYDAAGSTLRNGMRLAVTAPTTEVQAEARTTVYRMLLIFAWCFVIAALLMLVLTGRLARLYHMTFHDGLTGIWNRLGLDHALAEWQRTAKGKPAVYMTLDIDDFKLINDLQGHAAGDEALKALARRLSTFFGKKAIVARPGGDEFTVLLPETTGERAHALLTELTAHAQTFSYQGTEKTFTISLGYAAAPEDGTSLLDLAHRADAALYATKSKGKNGFLRYAVEQEKNTQHAFSLRDLSERLPGAILVHQADGRILYANDALITLFGCQTAEAFRAFSKGEAAALIHPDDKARVKAALAAQSSAKDTTATTRCRIVTQDGTTKHVCIITRQVPDEERGVVSYSVIVEAS